jgi:hypothetical protein
MPDPIKYDPNAAPSWRKPAGMFMILALIAVLAFVIMALSPIISALAWPLQAIVYAVAGVIWIMPLRPLLKWMELGTFR